MRSIVLIAVIGAAAVLAAATTTTLNPSFGVRHVVDLDAARVYQEYGSTIDVSHTKPTAAVRRRQRLHGGTPSAVTPAFSVNQQYAVYTSASVLRSSNADPAPKFVASDWLNPPYETVAYDATGAAVWQDVTSANKSELLSIRSASAKFLYSPKAPAGAVDVVSAMEEQGLINDATNCVVYGFSSKASGAAVPVWTYRIAQCYSDFVDASNNLVLSDDGSTVAVMVITNSTLPGTEADEEAPGPVVTTLQAHVLNAQTGEFLFGYSPAGQIAPRGLSISANGQYTAVSNGGSAVIVYVLDATTKTVRGGVNQGLSVGGALECLISPNGNHLVAGYTTLSVWQWVESTKQYTALATAPGNGNYLYASSLGLDGPDRLVIGAGWTNAQANGVVVSAYILDLKKATLTPAFTWTSPLNTQDQNIVSSMSGHLSYIAVATWGSYNEPANPVPQVLLFDANRGNTTVLSYITPGSMFMIDVYAQPHAKRAWVVAAGKHVQANTMGNGGDLFAFNVPI